MKVLKKLIAFVRRMVSLSPIQNYLLIFFSLPALICYLLLEFILLEKNRSYLWVPNNGNSTSNHP